MAGIASAELGGTLRRVAACARAMPLMSTIRAPRSRLRHLPHLVAATARLGGRRGERARGRAARRGRGGDRRRSGSRRPPRSASWRAPGAGGLHLSLSHCGGCAHPNDPLVYAGWPPKQASLYAGVSDMRNEMLRRHRFTLFSPYLINIFRNILHATVQSRMRMHHSDAPPLSLGPAHHVDGFVRISPAVRSA